MKSLNRRRFLAQTATLAATMRQVCALTAPSGTVDWQLGCYTRPWDAWDYRIALDGIAEAGFKYAGLMTHKGPPWILINVDTTPEAVESIAQSVKARGLRTLSIYGGDFPVAKSVPDGIHGLKKLIDHCALCECPNLLLGGTADDQIVSAYYQAVAECCDYAASKHVVLSIKPHGGANATGPQCRKLIEKIAHPSFRLWYDPGNIFYYSDGKIDPVDDAATVDRLVVGMSIKDFVPPKEVMVTPGTGRVDFAAVMARLGKGGFARGPLIVECLKKCSTAAEVTAEARRARQFLIELTAARS